MTTEQFYTLTEQDISKPAIQAFGMSWLVSGFMGRVTEQDVGKRVYLRDNVLQVENNEQLQTRLSNAPAVTIIPTTTTNGELSEEDATALATALPKYALIRTYQYAELSDRAKEAARAWWLDGQELLEPDLFQDDMRYFLKEEFGLVSEEFEFFWRLGCNQGDGVAFTGVLDADALFRQDAELAELVTRACPKCEVYIKVIDDGTHYHHWNTMRVEVEVAPDEPQEPDAGSDLEAAERELREEVLCIVQAASKRMEEIGYDTIEANESEEAVAENIEANEYRFTEYGSRSVTL